MPLLNGELDYTSNKFKDIEQKYIRNIDEWLSNLYIEVRHFDLVDFQLYSQKIELKMIKNFERPKKGQTMDENEVDEKREEDNDSDFDSDHSDDR